MTSESSTISSRLRSSRKNEIEQQIQLDSDSVISDENSDGFSSNDYEEEELFENSASSSNEGNTTSAENKLGIIRWPVIEYEDKAFSKESRELLRLCNNYMELYYKRYKERIISRTMLLQVRYFFEIYGLRQFDRVLKSRKTRKFHCNMGRVRFPNFCNIYLFLKEMGKLEDVVGQHMWDLYYISSPNLFDENRIVAQKYFNIRVLSVLRQIFKFVIKRDWCSVAAEIGNLRIMDNPQHHEKDYLKRTLDSFSFYLPSLYLVALQRHLESQSDSLILSHKFIQTAAAFIKTSQFRVGDSVHLNYSGFYAAHLLIFHVANVIFDSFEYISELNKKGVKNTDAAWSDAFNIYSYCHEFERFVSQNDSTSTQGSALARDLDHRFSMMLNILTARSAIGLLPAFVFIAITFDKIEELTEAIEQICDQNPGFIAYINEVLVKFGLERICGALVNRIILSPIMTPEMLAQHDFVIDIVEQRSLTPSEYGAFMDVVSSNLKILFNFLDNGRNRTNSRAWALLYSNIQYVKDDYVEVLMPYWKDRYSWWPKFHLSEKFSANDLVHKKKSEIFELLESINSSIV